MLDQPGFLPASWLSLSTGLVATALSALLAILLMAGLSGSKQWKAIRLLIPPFLAVPHIALAIGFAFLIMPSGLFFRLGYSVIGVEGAVPPDLLIVHDQHGLALIAGLVLRETPFLLFVLIGAASAIDIDHQLRSSASLGYARAQTWLFILIPQLYQRIRLPVLIVLAYGLTNADMAIILGPTNPPTLTLLILEWFRDPDTQFRFIGAAAALVQLFLVGVGFLLWFMIELGAGLIRRDVVNSGAVRRRRHNYRSLANAGLFVTFGVSSLCLVVLALWSIAGAWRFPDLLPTDLSLQSWSRSASDILAPLFTTLGIGAISAFMALSLVVVWFEQENWSPLRLPRRYQALLYIPLLIPQISFVFGLQIAMIYGRLDGSWAGVILSHLIFVIPYTALVLMDPYRKLDPRYARTARSLGHNAFAVFFKIKLPLLIRPIAFAWAIGFSVSCAQYLTTLFVGQGRVATLSLEALAYIDAGDRRLSAVMALLLALLPLIGFALAMLLPRFVGRQTA